MLIYSDKFILLAIGSLLLKACQIHNFQWKAFNFFNVNFSPGDLWLSTSSSVVRMKIHLTTDHRSIPKFIQIIMQIHHTNVLHNLPISHC